MTNNTKRVAIVLGSIIAAISLWLVLRQSHESREETGSSPGHGFPSLEGLMDSASERAEELERSAERVKQVRQYAITFVDASTRMPLEVFARIADQGGEEHHLSRDGWRHFLPQGARGSAKLTAEVRSRPHETIRRGLELPLTADLVVSVDLPLRPLEVRFERRDGSAPQLPIEVSVGLGDPYAPGEASTRMAFSLFAWNGSVSAQTWKRLSLRGRSVTLQRPAVGALQLSARDAAGRAGHIIVGPEAETAVVRLDDLRSRVVVTIGGAPAAKRFVTLLLLGCTSDHLRVQTDDRGTAVFPGVALDMEPCFLLHSIESADEIVSVRSFSTMESLGRLKLAQTAEGTQIDFPDTGESVWTLQGDRGAAWRGPRVDAVRLLWRGESSVSAVIETLELEPNSDLRLPEWLTGPHIDVEVRLLGQWVRVQVRGDAHALAIPELTVVQGRVETQDNNPIQNASVEVRQELQEQLVRSIPPRKVLCDAHGRFQILVPEPETAVLHFRADGWAHAFVPMKTRSAGDSLRIVLHSAVELDLQLLPSSEFANAEVSVHGIGRLGTSFRQTADESGRCKLPRAPGVRYYGSARSTRGLLLYWKASESETTIIAEAPPSELRRVRLGSSVSRLALRGVAKWESGFGSIVRIANSTAEFYVPTDGASGSVTLVGRVQKIYQWTGRSDALPGSFANEGAEAEFLEFFSSVGGTTLLIRDTENVSAARAYLEPNKAVRVELPPPKGVWQIGPVNGVPNYFPSGVGRLAVDDHLLRLPLRFESDLSQLVDASADWRIESDSGLKLAKADATSAIPGFSGGHLMGTLHGRDPRGSQTKLPIRIVHSAGEWVVRLRAPAGD